MTVASIDLEHVRRGALKAIREGRLTIRSVAYSAGPKAVTVAAQVRGFSGLHEIGYMSDQWRCSCDLDTCSHVLAAQLVTGHADAQLLLPRRRTETVDSALFTEPDSAERPAPPAIPEESQPLSDPARGALLAQRGWTAAAFAGKCVLCGTWYAKSDPIRATPRPDGQPGTRWSAACCIGATT